MLPVVPVECAISSVLSCRSKTLKGWMDQCYSSVLLAKENTSSRHESRLTQKTRRKEFNLGTSFYKFFLLPLSLPYVNWASQEGSLLYLRSSLWSSDLSLLYIHGLFPSLSFSHCHFGLLFPILTT